MMTFWLIMLFFSLTALIYGVLSLRELRKTDTPAE
jgi:hypothetical protein